MKRGVEFDKGIVIPGPFGIADGLCENVFPSELGKGDPIRGGGFRKGDVEGAGAKF